MDKMPHLLLIEDDPDLRAVLQTYLGAAGHQLTTASSAREGREQLQQAGYDLLILDINLPDEDGLEVCRKIRATSNLPILFVSARSDLWDRLLSLELGGDDYVLKPFHPPELVARVEALLRRSQGKLWPGRRYFGPMWWEPASFELGAGLKSRSLTASESALLGRLLENAGQLFTRAQLLEADNHSRSLDTHCLNLRRKLNGLGLPRDWIECLRGYGYRWSGPRESR